MKPKTMILMGLAIVCGLGASYMTSRLLADRGGDEKEMVKVLVAKKHLSIGDPIRKPDDLFEEKLVPKEDAGDAIREFEQLKDKILKHSRNKGDTITLANMYGKGESLDIPSGHVAVGLKVNQETNASGLASLPGSRVDLIWFQRGDKNDTSRSDILLEDVYVLAADGKIDRDGLTAVAQVVTLALTREQTISVNMAKETGIISFMLRRHGDDSRSSAVGLSGEELRKLIQRRNLGLPAVKPAEAIARNDTKTPAEEKKTPVDLPSNAQGKPDNKQQPDVVKQKTWKQELTVIEGNRIQRITREIAEDGTIVSEVRREDPLPALPQQAPRPKPGVPSIDA